MKDQGELHYYLGITYDGKSAGSAKDSELIQEGYSDADFAAREDGNSFLGYMELGSRPR
jgi:hypothetical protein